MKKTNNEKVKIIDLENVYKSYKSKSKKGITTINVLSDVSINFYNNTFYAIMGHSGSGKSTLINILGLVDNCDSGKYELYGKEIIKYNDKNLSSLRMNNIGFIFQSFYLKPTLKAYENVILPMLINKNISPSERKKRSIELLEKVGLADRINHFPNELSGGEQQRVAIARALANDPNIILADEPTGNLDEKNEKMIFELLKKLSNEGKCVIVVSHSDNVKNYADVLYKISDGKIIGERL